MKILKTTLIILIVILLGVFLIKKIRDNPLGAVQTEADIRQIIIDKEEDYFAQHGSYAQFLSGKETPADQTYTWRNVFGNRIRNNDFDIIIDVWDSNVEQGYTIEIIDMVATSEAFEAMQTMSTST